MKVAALDLGSNSFLLLILELQKDGSRKVIHDEAVIVRLAEGLLASGLIGDAALKRADQCLENFKNTIDKHQVSKIQAVTTAAAREAKNAAAFLSICRKHQIPTITLSGDEEAQMSFHGAISANQKENCVLIDIGGGSTEHIIGHASAIHFAESLPFGAVKLTEKFISSQPTSDKDVKALISFVKSESEHVWKQIEKYKLQSMIAVAGTPTAIAATMLGQFDAEKVDGFIITKEDLENWIQIFTQTSIAQKKEKYPLGARAEVILAGSLILYESLTRLGLNKLTVSTKGIRYGLAHQMLSSGFN
jgi:exopolyphosphatase/guanosine-5'-triphosphate,3'-diphosphate pyrophosphatase